MNRDLGQMTTNAASLENQLTAAANVVRHRTATEPSVGIILGSGLGGLAKRITVETSIPYDEIPGCHSTTTHGHQSELIFGELDGVPIAALSGRLHRYEGYDSEQIAFTTRLLSICGAQFMIVSNAAGGVSPRLCVGDIVVIRNHINWLGDRLIDRSDSPSLSPRRTGTVYDEEMSRVAMRVAAREHIDALEGTYLATLGPNYETRAEYRMMRRMGVDVVGMSTVPEVSAARELGMRVLGLSMVSNVANPDMAISADHDEVLKAGQLAESKMEQIVRGVLRWLKIR